MNILILGAAGQIGKMLTAEVLTQTNFNLVLYARNATTRLKGINNERIKIINGDFKDKHTLIRAMDKADLVYINDLGDEEATVTIIEAMKEANIERLIGASVLDIYNEVTGAFGQWNKRMIGSYPRMKDQIRSALAIENSGLDYTLLRLSWLYDQKTNKGYALTQKGESFEGTQVTRKAVVQLIIDIITAKDERFINKSLGVSEPDSNWDKPSFY
jgi:nucleoside-diphosphate-sugar epimerase